MHLQCEVPVSQDAKDWEALDSSIKTVQYAIAAFRIEL